VFIEAKDDGGGGYFWTDNLPLVFKLHEICSVDSQKKH